MKDNFPNSVPGSKQGGSVRWKLPANLVLAMIVVSHATQNSEGQRNVQTGVASYYAQEFHGRVTSNGERFNMYSLTAAHQTLPYNTLVKVTNLDNNKAVVV